MEKIKINRLKIGDWEIYHQLHLEALKENGSFYSLTMDEEKQRTEMQIKRELRRRMILGAFYKNKLIGKIGLSTRTRGRIKHIAKIFGVYVSPDFRKKGVAKEMFEQIMMEMLKRKEIEQLQLKLVEGNEVALGFYEKMGFLQFGVEKKAIKIGTEYLDEIYMQKFLK